MAVSPLQWSLIQPFPCFQQWLTPLGFVFTGLAQASQYTSPPFYLVHAHQSSIQVGRTGLLKHGSCAIPLLRSTQWFSNIYSTSSGPSAWLSMPVLTAVPAASSTPHLRALPTPGQGSSTGPGTLV